MRALHNSLSTDSKVHFAFKFGQLVAHALQCTFALASLQRPACLYCTVARLFHPAMTRPRTDPISREANAKPCTACSSTNAAGARNGQCPLDSRCIRLLSVAVDVTEVSQASHTLPVRPAKIFVLTLPILGRHCTARRQGAVVANMAPIRRRHKRLRPGFSFSTRVRCALYLSRDLHVALAARSAVLG